MMPGPVKVSTATVRPFTREVGDIQIDQDCRPAAQLEGAGVEGHRAVEVDGEAVDHRPLGGAVVDDHALDLRRHDPQRAEQTVCAVVGRGGEVQGVAVAGHGAVAEVQSQQAVDLNALRRSRPRVGRGTRRSPGRRR